MANKYEDIATAMSVLTGYVEGKNKALDTGDVEYKQVYDQEAKGYKLVPKKSLIGQTYQTGPVNVEKEYDFNANLDEISNSLDSLYDGSPVWETKKEDFNKFKGSISALGKDQQKTAIDAYRKKVSEDYADPDHAIQLQKKIDNDAKALSLGLDTGEEFKLVSEFENYGNQIFMGTLTAVSGSENGELYAQIFRDAGYLGEDNKMSDLNFSKTFDLVTADGVDESFDEILKEVEKIALENGDNKVLNTVAQWKSLSDVGLAMLNTAKSSNLGDNENIASNYRTQMKEALKAEYELSGDADSNTPKARNITLSEDQLKAGGDIEKWFVENISQAYWDNIKGKDGQIKPNLTDNQIFDLQRLGIDYEDVDAKPGKPSARKFNFTQDDLDSPELSALLTSFKKKAVAGKNINLNLTDDELNQIEALGYSTGWPEEEEDEEDLKYSNEQIVASLSKITIPENSMLGGVELNVNNLTDKQLESIDKAIKEKSRDSRPRNKYHAANAKQHIKNANSIFGEANMDASLDGIIDKTIENLITDMTEKDIKARHKQYFKQLKLGIENYFEASDSGIDAKVFIGYPEVAEAIHNKNENVEGFMEVIKGQNIKIIDGTAEIEINKWISDNYISNNKFETPNNPKNNVTISVNGQEFEIAKDKVLTELLNTYKKSYENFSTGTTEERSNQLDNLFLYYGMGPNKIGRKSVLFFFETVPDPKNYTLEDIK